MMTEDQLAQRNRDRQHGADIAADQRRATTGNRLWNAIPYGAGVLLAAAVLYVGAGAAGTETDNAPRAPAHLASGPNTPPSTPEVPPTQP